MIRQYENGESGDVVFFRGTEVEKTPAYGLQTLFVTGLQNINTVQKHLVTEDKHIFFGANHSFNPRGQQEFKYSYYDDWEDMIQHFLDINYLCSLDIPINAAEDFLESGLVEYENFIPQIRIPLPYVKQWNYNTMLKIDDKDFKATNPGVWCHSLHDLMDREKFTDWTKYTLDKPVE